MAFDQLTGDNKLVIIGEKMSWDKKVESAYSSMQNKDKVVFTGRLEGSELNGLIASSIALVFPSIYEGFGIPSLEAFQSGTAVITANNSAMPEVAGEGAILVDAENTDDIKMAMQNIAKDEGLRNTLINKGLKQLKNYSWDKSADQLWQLFVKTGGSKQ